MRTENKYILLLTSFIICGLCFDFASSSICGRTDSETPTNVLRLARALQPTGDDGVTQVLVYDAGVGTNGGTFTRILDGAVGRGIDQNIKDLYTFLVLNYCKGDEIYLFGFSRGAYTVRSLAGVIREAGLLRRSQVHRVHEAYQLYRSNVGSDSRRACHFRKTHGSRVPIKAVVCFDTVGALGIPKRLFGLNTIMLSRKYDFHNTTLSEDVDNAIHVLSIDETRTGKLKNRFFFFFFQKKFSSFSWRNRKYLHGSNWATWH